LHKKSCHHLMHSFTLALHTFSNCSCYVFLKLKPPCKFNNRGEVLQISNYGLFSNQRFCKSFQIKIQSKSEKKIEKKAKGPRGTNLVQPEKEPTAQHGSAPKSVSAALSTPLMRGPRPSDPLSLSPATDSGSRLSSPPEGSGRTWRDGRSRSGLLSDSVPNP
jgi:hypothetical protein